MTNNSFNFNLFNKIKIIYILNCLLKMIKHWVLCSELRKLVETLS